MRSDDIDKEMQIICPYCGEQFTIVDPPPNERPCKLDYDCEVCCRPLELAVEADGAVVAHTNHGE